MLLYQNTDSREVYLFTVLLTLLCALLFGLNILIRTFVSEEYQFKETGYSNRYLKEYPFFCDDLSLSSDEDYDTFNVKRKLYKYFLHNNRYTCSFRNLTEPLHKFVERKSRLRLASGLQGKQYLQCGNESLKKPSGCLSAAFRKVSRHQTYKGEGSNIKVHWDKHSQASFIAEDLLYHNGEIKVTEDRFYFLYTSVLINLTNVVINFGKAYRFLLQICVTSRGYERTLLYKSKVYYPNGSSSTSSLSVGGHCFLGKGDAVYVKVSEASRLIRDSAGNIFGILPLR